jgi:predicted glycoside hydrolase/deacetylase ChbG (UPF0249 family)
VSSAAKYLIVNADDLGASYGINRGIFEACNAGIVTSASLMVDMPASEDAAARLPEPSQLSVGLHVALTSKGGVVRVAARDCPAELERQFERFEQLMGRRPTHLDSHHNIHRDPRFREPFLLFARREGLPLREHSPARYFSSFYGQWDGQTHLEQIGVDSLIRMLESEVGAGVTELGCHPGYRDRGFRSSYGIERETELQTLCHPAVAARLEQLDIRLIGFADLATGSFTG